MVTKPSGRTVKESLGGSGGPISARAFDEASIVLANCVTLIDVFQSRCKAGDRATVKTMLQSLRTMSVPGFEGWEFQNLETLFIACAMEGGGVVSIAGFSEASAHQAAIRLFEEFQERVTGFVWNPSQEELKKEDFEARWNRMTKWPALTRAIEAFPSFDREYLLARLDQERVYVRTVLRRREQNESNPDTRPQHTGETSGGNKKRGGRKKDPKVQSRNKRIAADFSRGVRVDALVEKYGVSAPLARKIKSESKKAAKNRQS